MYSKVIQLYIYILFCTLFHYCLLQDTEYSSLCYTVGPCLYDYILNFQFSEFGQMYAPVIKISTLPAPQKCPPCRFVLQNVLCVSLLPFSFIFLGITHIVGLSIWFPFYCWIVLSCVNIPQCVYSFIILVVSSVGLLWRKLLWTFIENSLWIYVYVSLV